MLLSVSHLSFRVSLGQVTWGKDFIICYDSRPCHSVGSSDGWQNSKSKVCLASKMNVKGIIGLNSFLMPSTGHTIPFKEGVSWANRLCSAVPLLPPWTHPYPVPLPNTCHVTSSYLWSRNALEPLHLESKQGASELHFWLS